MPDTSAQLLTDIAKEWNRIERRAKEIESFRGEAIVASINEMRYAGRRIVDFLAAINNDDSSTGIEHLLVAKTYLMNADHDLTDSVIFVVHQRISAAEKKYGRRKIETNCPGFDEFYPSIVAAQKIVQGSREDRATRAAAYRKLAEEYVPKLIEIYNQMVATKALRIDEKLSVLERNVRLVGWLAFAGSVASIIGIGLSIYQICLAFYPPH